MFNITMTPSQGLCNYDIYDVCISIGGGGGGVSFYHTILSVGILHRGLTSWSYWAGAQLVLRVHLVHLPGTLGHCTPCTSSWDTGALYTLYIFLYLQYILYIVVCGWQS